MQQPPLEIVRIIKALDKFLSNPCLETRKVVVARMRKLEKLQPTKKD